MKDKKKPLSNRQLSEKTAIPQEKLKKYYELTDEYLLEARFDPENAKEKLSLILNHIPADSKLAIKIKESIANLN